ncbi:hypothetical protein A5699_18635 [Mycobacterium sp. E802]|uniref:DUF4303 domain-containing protein n=1 Tax=Mycobacterium sp. E802 TaxID=1834152 RepID=UPI0007FE3AD2|nr:DUF4303 domain-containing protein [Mycobacterium sp. E802]OBG87657.1 hypothetical protein A5699_18635 [Mycobacterium sp. E802]
MPDKYRSGPNWILVRVAFDWDAFETDLTLAAADAVRTLIASAPSETPYAVAFSEFYAETTGVIYLPNLALATEESVDDPDCRFSPPDWQYQDDEWDKSDPPWGDRLCAAVTGLPRAQWEQEWDRFAQAMMTVAAGTRRALVAEGTLPESAVVYLDDEAGDLLVRSVTPEELRRHFPEYAAAAEAERAVLAMPVPRRIEALAVAAGLIPGPPSELGAERAAELLIASGDAAVPVGIAALARRDTAWRGAKLLADLNLPTPDVLKALWAVVPLKGNGHDWAAAALGRLGAGRQVLARSDLPPATRAAAVTAPFTSFRDHGRGSAPLDYELLAAGLADGSIAGLVADGLKPGRGYCTLTVADLAGVRPGLDHVEPVIRRHAVAVISDLIGPMGPGDVDPDEVSALRQQITALATDDPDGEVRRLAGYRVRT